MECLPYKIKEELRKIVKDNGNYSLRFLNDEIDMGGLDFPIETAVIRKKGNIGKILLGGMKKLVGGYTYDIVVYRFDDNPITFVLNSEDKNKIAFAYTVKKDLESKFEETFKLKSKKINLDYLEIKG